MVDNQARWDAFILAQTHPQVGYLQVAAWGAFQQAAGRTVARLGVYDGGVLVAAALCVEQLLPFGLRGVLTPRGPIIAAGVDSAAVYAACRQHAFFAQAVFWRIEPLLPATVPAVARRRHDVQPAVTRVIDLTSSEEQLIEQMKQKTRYNIRLSQKKGVACVITPATEIDARDFFSLVTETSQRHGISPHARQYYQTMCQSLGKGGQLYAGRATAHGEVLAMILLYAVGDTVVYLHGASTQREKKLMAPYGLQWAAIKFARQHGAAWYDFFGVAPDDQAEHRLAGVTRFKNGFGGALLEYPGSFDIRLRPWFYRAYQLIRLVR